MKTPPENTAAPSVEVPRLVRPCDEPCAKCGSSDIQRNLRRERGSILYDPPERLKTKGRGATKNHPSYAIIGEYIRHQCRCCGFVWGSDCWANIPALAQSGGEKTSTKEKPNE